MGAPSYEIHHTEQRAFTLPLNNPDVVSIQEADHMKPDDIVVGIAVKGHARAYPWWILSNYHVANDTVCGKPVYVALCEMCSSSSAFSPVIKELPGRPLAFRISGVAFGTFEISDIQTLSQWHPFSGICVSGPLKGRKLEKIPSAMTRWELWQRMKPNTDVVYASPNMRERPHGKEGREIAHSNMLRIAEPNLDDDRLPSNELVYGLVGTQGGTGLAFPLRDLRKFSHVETMYAGLPILVFLREDYQVMAYIRELNGEVLTFKSLGQDSLPNGAWV
ncbi:DUF3179 domain-containing protein [bacterium]|nr:DUF3179 domain-containing protein [bacterium]